MHSGTTWSQQAYLKASNTGAEDRFGFKMGVSSGTVVIATPFEDSNATGVNGNQSDNSASGSGAAYVFTGLGIGPKLSIAPTGTGGYLIRFTGIPGVDYRLERCSSMSESWGAHAMLTAPQSGLVEFYDLAPPPSQAFYRTVQP